MFWVLTKDSAVALGVIDESGRILDHTDWTLDDVDDYAEDHVEGNLRALEHQLARDGKGQRWAVDEDGVVHLAVPSPLTLPTNNPIGHWP